MKRKRKTVAERTEISNRISKGMKAYWRRRKKVERIARTKAA